MQRSMFNASNGLQTPVRSRAINVSLEVPRNPAVLGWTDEDRPPGGPMFALKTGTKPRFLAPFLTRLRECSTRSIQEFPGDKISFRVVIHDGLVAHSPLTCPPKPRRRRVAHLPAAGATAHADKKENGRILHCATPALRGSWLDVTSGKD